MKHIIVASAVAIILILLLFAWMNSYTHHGDVQPVPDLTGLDFKEARDLLQDEDLRIMIEDSTFVPDATPGTVVSQNPPSTIIDSESGKESARMVKENRKIYVKIASYLPPKVEIPNLVGQSKRSALNLLGIIGIEVNEIEYVPDRVCTDCVLKQLYEGKEIVPGTRLYRGEGITLILGKRDSRVVSIPKLEGMMFSEAKNILNRVSLNMGEILGCDGCRSSQDTSRAYVLRQDPELGGSAESGSQVDVYLTRDISLLP